MRVRITPFGTVRGCSGYRVTVMDMPAVTVLHSSPKGLCEDVVHCLHCDRSECGHADVVRKALLDVRYGG